MKKIISLGIAFVLTISLMACGKSGSGAEKLTPAGGLASFFESIVKEDATLSCEEIAGKIIENETIPFMAGTMPVEPGYLNGFSDEITLFNEGCQFGPMISTIPFIGYVFDTDDVEGLIASLEELSDLNWNICTTADEKIVRFVGSKVFFIMAPVSFDQE